MPQPVPDVWAWWRTFLSQAGPKPTLRLVLTGYMRRMDRRGRSCWAGVRDVAELTGLNKDTVAAMRAEALRIGWLTEAVENRRRVLWASVPDGIFVDPRPEPTRAQRLHNSMASTNVVRTDRTACPAPSDISLELSITQKRSSESGESQTLADATESLPGNAREVQLRRWLANDARARTYWHDAEALGCLAPFAVRFEGYLQVIQDFVNRARQGDVPR